MNELLLALSLILNGGAAERPYEDDAIVGLAMSVSEVISEQDGGDARFTYEPIRRNIIFIGAFNDDTGCVTGTTWTRGTFSPIETTC